MPYGDYVIMVILAVMAGGSYELHFPGLSITAALISFALGVGNICESMQRNG